MEIVECMEIIDVGYNLKQVGGLTRQTLCIRLKLLNFQRIF